MMQLCGETKGFSSHNIPKRMEMCLVLTGVHYEMGTVIMVCVYSRQVSTIVRYPLTV